MRDKSSAMLAASTGRHTVKSGGKSTEKCREEAMFATQVKHTQEEHDEESKTSSFSFLVGLKACAQKKDLYQVSRIHTELCNSGLLQKDPYLGSTLVSVYAKCGVLMKAREVLDGLPVRNVITWNALIVGYAQHGCGKEALGCFHQMRREGLSPDAITYACTLKACGFMQDIDMGERIHDEIASQGLLKKSVVLGGALVDMYAKCGALTKAQKVLDGLPIRNVISWSALIAGYAQHDCGKEAVCCFHQMRREGLSPNAITYACTLKACGLTQDVDMGERIHDEIAIEGLLEKDVVLGSALVDMYAKCGALTKAQKVLDELSVRNVVSWSALIAGYAQHGCGKEALSCFHLMRRESLLSDAITYGCILKACGFTQDVGMGERIHNEIASQGMLEKGVVLGGALVDMYTKCGALRKAQKVLDGLPVRNVVSWSTLIAGYAHHGCSKEALGCFNQMRREGISPDAVTYACIFKACGLTQDLHMGERIHDEIAGQGLLENHVVLGNALVEMYARCGALTKARKVLEQHSLQDVVSWNVLIAGYAQHGCGKEALDSFGQMRREGLAPDAITYVSILKACGSMQDVDMGERIHEEIASEGLLEKGVVLGGALIDMYAKCGALTKAQKVLDWLPVRNVVTWSALIAGYAQHGCGKEAVCCFHRMQREGLSPNAITYACTLKACGLIQDVDMGERIHDEIASQGLLEKGVVIGGALVDMYAKCGALMKAREVLDGLPVRNVITWNALIAGYAQHGCGKEALVCFKQMQSEGFSPDEVSWSALIGGYAQQGLAEEALNCFCWMQHEGTSPTAITFLIVLNACSRSGLVDEGQMLFDSMREKYGITPDKEHYTCMVDLYGRARHFDKAMRVIKKMPSSDCPPVWSALLGACQNWGNVDLGRLAFENVIQLDKFNAAAYVLMSNIYAAAGMQDAAQNIECMRVRNGAWKQLGHIYWTDASVKAHRCVVGDTEHLQSRQIYLKLQDLELTVPLERYSPNLHCVSKTCVR